MRGRTLGVGALLVAWTALADSYPALPQIPATASAVVPAAPPALLVKISSDQPSEPLGVVKAEIEVVITGFLAETTTTLTFANPHARALEGELIFPLPEEATISGYALDVGGEMVDGVVVERHEARIAFEAEVRKGIDPGLVEWVKGSNFRTRVFPIPAHGRRTVRVRYVSDLVTRTQGTVVDALYALPLRFRKPIADFSLKVEVVKGAVRPEVRGGGLANFRFDQWEDRYVARTRLTDVQPAEDLLIALPEVPRESVAVEKDDEGRAYFVIADFPEVSAVTRSVAKARRVGLFWDASLSRDGADHKRELELLEAWLRQAGDVDVDVVVFRNVPEAPRAFAIRGGVVQPLVAFLESVVYDGATNLGALRFEGPRLRPPLQRRPRHAG